MAVVIAFPLLSSDESSVLRGGAAQPLGTGAVRRVRQALRRANLHWRTVKMQPEVYET